MNIANMNVENLSDIYSDYLLLCSQQATATELSRILEGEISHDKITRMLSSGNLNSNLLWKKVKPYCHEIKSEDAVLIIDDTVEVKPYSKINEVNNYYFDHTQGRCVKGINVLSALYHSQGMSVPIGVEVIRKKKVWSKKKKQLIYKVEKNKNEHFRGLLEHACHNTYFKYVLSDCWFSSSQNMECIVKKHHRHFIFALKQNRKVALSLQDKEQGRYVSIQALKPEGCTMSVYVEQLDFPLLVTKQVFKNGDGSTGALYLASDNMKLTSEQITTIYQKRWKVECYHKSIKSYAAFAKSPAHTPTTQTSHLVACSLAYLKLEWLKERHAQNHLILKQKLMVKSCQASLAELKRLSTPLAA